MTTTVTLRPQSTGLASNWTYTGGPTTLHGVSADDLDSTFATASANQGEGSMLLSSGSSFTMPAGAQIRSVTSRLRMKGNGASTNSAFAAWTFITGERSQALAYNNFVPGSITAYNLKPSLTDAYGAPWTASRINRLWFHIVCNSGVGIYRLAVDVLYSEQPVVSGIGPTGSQTSVRPTVTWVYSTPDTAAPAQERWVVRIFSDAAVNTAGFDPETSANIAYDSGSAWMGNGASTQHTIAASLAPGTYWSYVKASDVGSNGRYSNWASASFQVAGTPPASPTLVSAVADTANGRVVVTVRENDNLLGYNQAGLEAGATDGDGWYIDSGVTTLDNGASSADIEGTRALRMTSSGAVAAKARCGGTWSSTGLGGSQNLGIDTHEAAGNANDGTAALVSASFTPTAGAIVYAFIGSDGSTANLDLTAEASLGGGAYATMTLVRKCRYQTTGTNIDASGIPGEASIWRVQATGSAITVRIPQTPGYHRRLKVVSFTGADTTTPVGASGGGGATTNVSQNYTSTRAGSWGWMSYTDFNVQSITAGTGCNIYSQTTDPNFTAATIDRAGVTSLSGSTVNISTTGAGTRNVNYVYMEVMPATGVVSGIPSTLLAGVPVQAGTVYTVNGRVWQAANAARICRVNVEWWAIDTAGSAISTTLGTSVTTLTTTKMKDATWNVTAPAGAVAGVLILEATNPAGAGEVFHWDSMGLTPGAGQKWSRGGMQAQNLFDTDDGSADSSIGTWIVVFGSAVLSRTSDAGVKSGFVLQQYGATPGNQAASASGSLSGAIPGQPYTFYAAAYTILGTINGYVKIQFEDDDGAVLGTAISTPVSLGSAGMQVLSATAVCPATATKVRGIVINDYVASANAVRWTRLGIAPGSTVPAVWQPGPLPASYPLVESSDDGGVTWTALRLTTGATFTPAAGWQAVVYDYEAPPNAPRLYRASVAGIDYGIDPLGFYTVSAPSASVSVTLPVTDWYLVDPYTQVRIKAPLLGDVGFTSDEPQATFDPMGRTYPVIQSDVTKGERFTLRFGFTTAADYDAFDTLRRTQHVLLLLSPSTRYWYIKLAPSRDSTWYQGTMTLAAGGLYTVAIPAIQVSRP